MPTKKYNIELTDNERRELTKIVKCVCQSESEPRADLILSHVR